MRELGAHFCILLLIFNAVQSDMAFSPETKNYAIGRQNGRCALCGYNLRRSERVYDFHHIQPTSAGGQDTLDNCVALCNECHRDEAHVSGNTKGYVLTKSEYTYLNG